MTKKLWTGWGAALLAAVALTGCNEESTPGGPGATPVPAENTTEPGAYDAGTDADTGGVLNNQPDPGEPVNEDATFQLQFPTGATNVEQGQAQGVTISIDRGSEFAEDVNVTLTPPQGITVDPQQFTIRSGQDEMEVTVTADATATPGEQIIDVEGKSASGPPAKGQLKIEVTEADNADAGTANPNAGFNSPAVREQNADSIPPAAPPANPQNPEAGAPPAEEPQE